jgi:hypothetical protein
MLPASLSAGRLLSMTSFSTASPLKPKPLVLKEWRVAVDLPVDVQRI